MAPSPSPRTPAPGAPGGCRHKVHGRRGLHGASGGPAVGKSAVASYRTVMQPVPDAPRPAGDDPAFAAVIRRWFAIFLIGKILLVALVAAALWKMLG